MEKIIASDSHVERWGFWATLGFSLLIAILYYFGALLTALVMVAINLKGDPGFDTKTYADSLGSDGFFLSVSSITTAFVGIGLIYTFIVARGCAFKQYLSLNSVSIKAGFYWALALMVYFLAMGALSFALDRPTPEFMVSAYTSTDNLPLLWVAIVVAAPLAEEFFFRGFLFEGLRDSRLGSYGAVFITSIAWAGIHLQYELYEISQIFILGLLFGAAKIRTQSLYIPLALHSINNLVSMVMLALFLE